MIQQTEISPLMLTLSAVTPWGEPMGALGYGCEGTVMAAAQYFECGGCTE